MSINYITCATKGCGYSPFPVDAGFDDRARQTGETFYCPAGHSLVYNGGKSKDQKKIEELQQLIEWRDARIRRLERDQWRCRWTGCMFLGNTREGLGTHMRAIHGMPTLAEVREAS